MRCIFQICVSVRGRQTEGHEHNLKVWVAVHTIPLVHLQIVFSSLAILIINSSYKDGKEWESS